MTTLSLRVPDELQEVDAHAEELHLPRAAYVRKALELLRLDRERCDGPARRSARSRAWSREDLKGPWTR
jgi:predicted transcriptional regulator